VIIVANLFGLFVAHHDPLSDLELDAKAIRVRISVQYWQLRKQPQ
jgi:hypothetical protein